MYNFRLDIGNKSVYPILDRGHYFVDFGKPYQKEKIKSKEKSTYVLTYELTESDIQKEYQIKILENIISTNDNIESNYKIINLKPQLVDKIIEKETFDLGKILTLKDTNIGYTTLKINSAKIANNYTYSYEQCYQNNKCQTIKDRLNTNATTSIKTTLLILNSNYRADDTTYYSQANRDFFNDFASVRYTINGMTKIAKTTNRTTKNMKDTIVLETNEEIKYADDIELLITIRNMRYTMKLK